MGRQPARRCTSERTKAECVDIWGVSISEWGTAIFQGNVGDCQTRLPTAAEISLGVSGIADTISFWKGKFSNWKNLPSIGKNWISPWILQPQHPRTKECAYSNELCTFTRKGHISPWERWSLWSRLEGGMHTVGYRGSEEVYAPQKSAALGARVVC